MGPSDLKKRDFQPFFRGWISKRAVFVAAIILCGFVTWLYSQNLPLFSSPSVPLVDVTNLMRKTNLLLNKGDSTDDSDILECILPQLDPWPEALTKFYKPGKKKKCQENTFLFLDSRNALRYNISHPWYNKTKCCAVPFSRLVQDPNAYNASADSGLVRSSQCIEIPVGNDGLLQNFEFAEITCPPPKGDKKSKKLLLHSAVPLPPDQFTAETKRISEGWKAFLSNKSGESSSQDLPPSIVLVGIDNMSRLSMLRSIPKTQKMLLENNFLDFTKYLKAGEGTIHAVMAMYAGLTSETWTCWKDRKTKFDDCPFLWKNFRAQNYITALIEEGFSAFDFRKVGFVEQPTHYYYRPFSVAYGGEDPTNKCAFGKLATDYTQDYILRWMKTIGNDVPVLALNWFDSVAHNDFNGAMLYDDMIKDMMLAITKQKAQNSIIILMSDHGQRYGSYRETNYGLYEEAAPFMFMRFPESLQRSHPMWFENLKVNSQRLVSPLDIHETFKSVLSLSSPNGEEDTSFESNSTYVSLFENIVPRNRTCDQAGVPPQYCRCGYDLNGESERKETAIQFAKDAVDKINTGILAEALQTKSCLKLEYKSFLYAHSYASQGGDYRDFIVGFVANPAGAKFEATYRYYPADKAFELRGEISRINSYKGQNDCKAAKTMPNFCTCPNYKKG